MKHVQSIQGLFGAYCRVVIWHPSNTIICLFSNVISCAEKLLLDLNIQNIQVTEAESKPTLFLHFSFYFFFYPFTPPASFPSPTHCLSPSLSEVNRSEDAGWGHRWARQRPCGSHLPITSVWFMSGPPQSQHSPRSTVPSALLTIINLHPTLPWHTEACMQGPFTVRACVLQCTACVWGSSNHFLCMLECVREHE